MRSSFIPGTKVRPGGSPVSPPGPCVLVPVLVCACAHVCVRAGGRLSPELAPRLPWGHLSLQPGNQVCPASSPPGSPALPSRLPAELGWPPGGKATLCSGEAVRTGRWVGAWEMRGPRPRKPGL